MLPPLAVSIGLGITQRKEEAVHCRAVSSGSNPPAIRRNQLGQGFSIPQVRILNQVRQYNLCRYPRGVPLAAATQNLSASDYSPAGADVRRLPVPSRMFRTKAQSSLRWGTNPWGSDCPLFIAHFTLHISDWESTARSIAILLATEKPTDLFPQMNNEQ